MLSLLIHKLDFIHKKCYWLQYSPLIFWNITTSVLSVLQSFCDTQHVDADIFEHIAMDRVGILWHNMVKFSSR